jgi:hypothetical protein
MNEKTNQETWSKNVILVDADYIDRVAFDLIVNFERMLGRRILQADLAHWIDCVALDGGMQPSPTPSQEGGDCQVIFLHTKRKLENFVPGDYARDLDGKAFSDNLGEFAISTLSEEHIISRADLLIDTLQLALHAQEVKRIVVVPDEEYYDDIRTAIRHAAGQQEQTSEKRITLMAMQPMPGGTFYQEILGYSLMSALGIKSEEIPQ